MWGVTAALGMVMAYFLIAHVRYERIYREPGEKGRWSPLVIASALAVAGFVACSVLFL